jgi:DNA recombination protein RmuC
MRGYRLKPPAQNEVSAVQSPDVSWLEQTLSWIGDASTLPPEVVAAGSTGLALGILLGAVIGGLLCTAITAAILSRTNARLQDRFRTLSSDALDRNNERFLALAGERLGSLERSNVEALAQREAAVDALVRPLRESLARVDEKLQKVETERQGHYQSLTKHLEMVATSHRELERQTRGLGQALRTPNVRGRWGELQLRRVVELAGMLEHCDFQEQVSIGGEDGQQRPDLIVHLPGGRQIVIDAKAPLQAYLAASEAEDDAARARHLDDHARHVRRHVDDLGGRNYWSQLAGSPEFVVLFLPGEPFFSAALAHDPELIERGVERRVLLAGPTTLIALLRAVAYGWQQEAMAENTVQVSKLGRELFERIVTLNDRFGELGKKLDGAVVAFNAAVGTLESRVHVSARRMAELGVAKEAELETTPTLDRRTRTLAEAAPPSLAAPPAESTQA